MKSKLLLFLPVLFFTFNPHGRSQNAVPDNTIRVTTTLHADGTRTVMQTDPEKHAAECSDYDHANKLLKKIVFDLDEQGQTIGGAVFSSKGVLVAKMQYKRDAMNRVSEVTTYTPDDRLTGRLVYHYDSNNRVVKIDAFDANGNAIKSGASGTSTPTPGKKGLPYRNH